MTDRSALRTLLLTSATALCFAAPAYADDPATALAIGVEDPQSRATQVDDVEVKGEKTRAPLPTLPSAVEDTPQVINVLPRELLEQQNVTTLAEALRNVPGITIAIGEGNGGLNGDQFRIRGLDAKDDIYIDGLRDFGVYTRDSFNYEQIEVLKGPSGATLGRGTTAGAINTTSKTPRLRDFTAVTAGAGSADFLRGTIDWNRQINDTTAIRINVMGTRTDVADRDLVEADRWAIAPTLAWGLGTNTEFTLGYLHQEGSGRPDFGVPVVAPDAMTLGLPITELGVDRSNFYGYESDLDKTTADVVTFQLNHVVNDWLSIRSASRLGWYDRDFGASAVSCGTTVLAGTPAGTIPCVTAFFDNDPATIPFGGAGGFQGYVQESWGVQNVTTALITAPLAGHRNELVVGIDVSHQDNIRDIYSFVGTTGVTIRPPLNLLDPNTAFSNVRATTPASSRVSDGKDYSIFASNQFWLTDAWSFVTGLRAQRYEADYTTLTYATPTSSAAFTRLSSDSDLLNPKASLIWQPDEDTTAYVSWARSATPIGTSITNAPNSIGSAAASDLDPEENETFEAGLKATVFDNLLIQASAFQIDKNNVIQTDGAGTITASGDGQRVRGVELALNGSLTEHWSLIANYTYLDAEITDSTTAANIGRTAQFVPEHAASFWTAYEVGALTVGGGVTWQDELFLNAGNTSQAPSNVSLDAMVSYQVGRVKVQVNGYNLTDELNYSQVFGNRVVPSSGRTGVLTLSTTF